MRREGGRTLHYGAGSGVVGPHVADSEGEAKNYKRHAQDGVEGVPHTGPKPLLPYSTRTKGKRQTPSPDQSVADKRSCRPARRPDRCRSNQISKRRQTRGSPRNHWSAPPNAKGKGGPGGRAAAGEHQTKPNKTTRPDTEANQPTKEGQAPLAPLDSYRSFQPRKNMIFSINPVINYNYSINLKRDGSRNLLRKIFGKVTYWRLSYSAIDSILCQLHWVIELKHSTSSGAARSSKGLVNVAWVVLHRKSPHWS